MEIIIRKCAVCPRLIPHIKGESIERYNKKKVCSREHISLYLKINKKGFYENNFLIEG